MKLPPKPASRIQLLTWLAQAMRYVPPNLCDVSPFSLPPVWVKKALAELKRNGITYKPRSKEKEQGKSRGRKKQTKPLRKV